MHNSNNIQSQMRISKLICFASHIEFPLFSFRFATLRTASLFEYYSCFHTAYPQRLFLLHPLSMSLFLWHLSVIFLASLSVFWLCYLTVLLFFFPTPPSCVVANNGIVPSPPLYPPLSSLLFLSPHIFFLFSLSFSSLLFLLSLSFLLRALLSPLSSFSLALPFPLCASSVITICAIVGKSSHVSKSMVLQKT